MACKLRGYCFVSRQWISTGWLHECKERERKETKKGGQVEKRKMGVSWDLREQKDGY